MIILFHLAIRQYSHASLSLHGLQDAAYGLSSYVSVHRNLRLRNHLYIVNAGIRHIHRQDALCLHLLMIEFIYVVETHIAVGLAVNESYAYRIFIGGDGSEDEFSPAYRLNTLPLSRCRSSAIETLQTLPLSYTRMSQPSSSSS